ncbi:MAG: hypothetical protein U9R25_14140 [Chloroflexota bacterium]|nr:hypothetical protein [Chloroflexota bacterium]
MNDQKTESPPGQTSTARPAVTLLLATAMAITAFLAFVYLLTNSGIPHNPDEWFFLKGTQAALDGDLGSVQRHGWLYSVLLSPFYALSALIPRLGSFQSSVLLTMLVTALTAGLLYLLLTDLGASPALGAVSSLAYGLGTLAWPYSHYLFREPLAAFLLLFSFFASARFYRGGHPAILILGLVSFFASIAVKGTLLAFLPFWAGLTLVVLLSRYGHSHPSSRLTNVNRWLRQIDQVPAGWLWFILFVVVWMLMAAVVVAAAVVGESAPDVLQRGPNLVNFIALWVSPGWGLLPFAPVLLIAFFGAPSFMRRHPVLTFAAIGGSLLYVLAASGSRFWWGYWGYGPRQLLPLIPLLCLPMPDGLRWLHKRLGAAGKAIAVALIALSIAIQAVGVVVPFSEYAREVLLPANIAGPDVAWNLRMWPPLAMLRFARPEILDPAWIVDRTGGSVRIDWRALLPALAGSVLSLLWLISVVRSKRQRRAGALLVSGMLVLAWFPVAVLAAQASYLDERYQPDMGFASAAERVRQEGQPGDLLITDLWTDNLSGPVVGMLNYCRAGCPPRLDLTRETLTDRETDWQNEHLSDLDGYSRAWLVLERVPEGDPNSIVEQWLGTVGFPEGCEWTGPQVRLCRFNLQPGDLLETGVQDIVFEGQVTLDQAVIRHVSQQPAAYAVAPGDTMQVELVWRAQETIPEDLVVSLQVLGPADELIAGIDRRPGGGFRPLPTWEPGERVLDRFSITLPEDLPFGTFKLAVLLYDPENGRRLPVLMNGEAGSDVAVLRHFEVLPRETP